MGCSTCLQDARAANFLPSLLDSQLVHKDYSSTPLPKKLGIDEASRVALREGSYQGLRMSWASR